MFHFTQSICSKNDKKEEIECEVAEFEYGYEKDNNTDFLVETADNFPLTFNEFYNISPDSFKDMASKYVDDISLTDKENEFIEYSTRGQFSNL